MPDYHPAEKGQNSTAFRVGITIPKNNKADHITSRAKHLGTAACIALFNVRNANSPTRHRNSKTQINMASKNNSITNIKSSLQPSHDVSSVRSGIPSNDTGGTHLRVGRGMMLPKCNPSKTTCVDNYNGNISAIKPADSSNRKDA